jgi:glycolate oxidase FAD binding subunit
VSAAGGQAEARSATAHELARAGEQGHAVRPAGGGTKAAWGAAGAPAPALPRAGSHIQELNAGDLTAVVDAGTPLTALTTATAAEGQMLALDPPLGEGSEATLGGAVAANDSGPLRHRYGSARDLVVGITVALSDGTVAKAGGRVIKNVAGYDLAKLFTGSFGTLGAILDLSVRLHPLPKSTATARGRGAEPRALAAAASELSHAQLELQSLDVRWEEGAGALLARFGGHAPGLPAGAAAEWMARHGLEADVVLDDDEGLWSSQREAQRSDADTVVKVSGVQTQLPGLLEIAARLRARVVGRAGLGLSWVTLAEDPLEGVAELRRALAPAHCVVLDAPPEVRAAVDVWGPRDPGALALMRSVKERFDPAGVCSPGALALT